MTKVIDSWKVSDITFLTLSDALPEATWHTIIIDGMPFDPLIPMYGGDISRLKNNAVGIRGSFDLTGKTVEFI